MILALLLACEPTEAPKTGAFDTGSTACDRTEWRDDADGDGFGGDVVTLACEPPDGAVASGGDCDDGDAEVHPGAAELCDGLDQDCDDAIDEDLPRFEVWEDADGDGYGDPWTASVRCDASGTADNDQDCDDTDAAISPAGTEICNDIDDDCDGLADDADDSVTGRASWYWDYDGDGYGSEDVVEDACDAPAEYVAAVGDCDTAEGTIYPGAPEICLDAVDQDCDGLTDDYTGSCELGPPGEISASRCDTAAVPLDESFCGSGVAAVLSSGAGYALVQDALDAATAGEVVTICPGAWSEALTVSTSPLTLVGYGADRSILTSPSRILDLGTGNAVTLVDLAFENGVAAGTGYGGAVSGEDTELCVARAAFAFNEAFSGGAIYLGGTSSLVVDESFFFANQASYEGAGIYLLSQNGDTVDFLVEDSVFYGNVANYGGGGIEAQGENAGELSNVSFEVNSAGYEGGGMAYGNPGSSQTPSTLTLDGVVFTANVAGYDGGGLRLASNDSSTYTLRECSFVANEAVHSGGGIAFGSRGDPTMTIEDSTFQENSAIMGGGLSVGSWGDHTVSIERSVFESNTTTYDGGGIQIYGWGLDTVTITDSSVLSNTARNYGGVQTFDEGSTLVSVNTDWGTGGTDNTPDDVAGNTWPGVADFTCVGDTCY